MTQTNRKQSGYYKGAHCIVSVPKASSLMQLVAGQLGMSYTDPMTLDNGKIVSLVERLTKGSNYYCRGCGKINIFTMDKIAWAVIGINGAAFKSNLAICDPIDAIFYQECLIPIGDAYTLTSEDVQQVIQDKIDFKRVTAKAEE